MRVQGKRQKGTARKSGMVSTASSPAFNWRPSWSCAHTPPAVGAPSLVHYEEPNCLPYTVRITLLWPSPYAPHLSLEGLRAKAGMENCYNCHQNFTRRGLCQVDQKSLTFQVGYKFLIPYHLQPSSPTQLSCHWSRSANDLGALMQALVSTG